MQRDFQTILRVAIPMIAAGAILLPAKSDPNRDTTQPRVETQGAVVQEILVETTAQAGIALRQSSATALDGQVVDVVYTPAMQALGHAGFAVVKTTLPISEALTRLRRTPGVRRAEPNGLVNAHVVSNDTVFVRGNLWGMLGATTTPSNIFGSGAAAAWAKDQIGSADVLVGVIDTGVAIDHPDLAANIWNNPFDPIDGIDNDGNGYVDDTNGWDFLEGNRTVFDGMGDTHGTHVAGTIGARGGNGIGVAGVCWNVRIICAKFLGAKGGTIADAVRALDYMTDLKLRHGINLVAVNASWGSSQYSSALSDAVERARQADILVVAAAGNSKRDTDIKPDYPSGYPHENIISVASIMNTGARSGFSNYGANSIDIGAPGSGITSTVPLKGGKYSYGSMSGTSMAAPHVTGAAALYAATHPLSATNAAAIKGAILGSALPTPGLTGITVTGGRLNVADF